MHLQAIVFPNQDFTFAQLQNMCTAFNSRMVSIHSQAENNFVFSWFLYEKHVL